MPYQRLIIAPEVATMFSPQDRPAERVAVRLERTTVTSEQLQAELRNRPIPGLREVIVIDKDRNVIHAFSGIRQ